MAGERSPARRRLIVATIAVAAMALGLVLYGSSGRDDAYITYGAADSLIDRGVIANINHERLEQSSTLLFTLAIAAVSRVTTLAVPDVAIALGIAFGLLTIAAAAAIGARFEPRLAVPVALVVATSPCLLYWSFSGMEATLTALLALWATHSAIAWLHDIHPSRARLLSVASSFLLFAMVRPETGLVLIAALLPVGVVIRSGGRGGDALFRRWLPLLAAAVGSTLVILVFRRLYFGAYFPQPVIAKSSGLSAAAVRAGASYLWQQRACLVSLVPAAVGVGLLARDVVDRRGVSAAAVPSAMVGSYLACVVAAGGDWMELGRFLVPVVPLLAVCALDPWPRTRWRAALATVTAVLVLANAIGLARSLAGESTGIAAWNWRAVDCRGSCGEAPWHERYNHIHRRDLGFLPRATQVVRAAGSLGLGRPVSVLSVQAGMVAYYLERAVGKQMYFIDACGLVTDHATRCPLTARAEKSSLGTCMPINEILSRRAELRDQCGIDPDIVYGLFPGTPKAADTLRRTLGALGYRVVIADSFPASLDGSLRRPLQMTTGEYLAVREDLAARLPELGP
jgi:hypothetical protein